MRLSVVLALLVALTGSAWAHRAPAQPIDPGLRAYIAAGGLLSDICGPGGGATHSAAAKCDACRLVDTLALPAVTGPCRAIADTPRPVHVSAETAAEMAALSDPSRLVRAPPLV